MGADEMKAYQALEIAYRWIRDADPGPVRDAISYLANWVEYECQQRDIERMHNEQRP